MDEESKLRKSMAQLRQSIYGSGEVDFVDLFQYDMDEDDHVEIRKVMHGSLNRIPGSFRTELISQYLGEHPEIYNIEVDAVDDFDKDIEDLNDFALESVKRSRWTLFHKEFQRQVQEWGRTFTIQDPEEFWKSVKEKFGSHIDTVRLYAIQKLGNDINNDLYMIYKLNTCKSKEIRISDYEHFNIFSWTEDKFMARRQMRGIAWVDIFRKSLTEECLDAFKTRYDIMELAGLIRLILMSFFCEDEYEASETLTTIYDAFNLMNMQNKLVEELEESIEYFCDKINQITNVSNKRRSQNRDVIKNFLEMELMSSWVKTPLENRYQMNHMQEKVSDWQDQFEMRERELVTDLNKSRTKLSNEQACFEYTMQCMYNTIEDYKLRIAKMSNEYDKRFTEINEKNTFLRVSLDKMKIRREFLEQENIYMQHRIREILLAGTESKMRTRRSRHRSHSKLPPTHSKISLTQSRISLSPSLASRSRKNKNSSFFAKNSII